jgi:pimeloyl-ACP methyl ester carboxylesterase
MKHAWSSGTVASGGEDIYFEVVGAADAPAVVLTHGAGGNHAIWYQQTPVLADAGYRVVAWDCRGWGNSSFRSGQHGCDAAIADMRAVLDELGIQRAHLVGQSMGGWWVTAFTLVAPERVLSLTLSNTVGGLWTDALFAHFRPVLTTVPSSERTVAAHPALGPSFCERDAAHAFLYQQINTFQTPPMIEAGFALMDSHVAHADLDATGVPVLVITSDEDALFPATLVVDSASRLAHATILEIRGAGHSTYFEKPEEYNDALLQFVGKHA